MQFTARQQGKSIKYLPAKLIDCNRNIDISLVLLNDKLYINAGSGLAAGVAKINVSKKVGEHTIFSEDSWNFNIGIPIQIGGQYFFTKNIGVNLTLADVLALGVGIGSSFHRGFENVFTLKVGPMFKF